MSEQPDERYADPAATAFANMAQLAGSKIDPTRIRPAPKVSRQTDQPKGRRRWSGAGPSTRDPKPVGAVFSDLAKRHGWATDLQKGRVLSHWDSVVGAQLAAKTKAVSLRDGELEVRAESTAWATQLRAIERTLLTRIEQLVGPGVVRRLVIKGPVPPSWKHGRRSVRGRGPRDTYG